MKIVRNGFSSDQLFLSWWDLVRLAFGVRIVMSGMDVQRRPAPSNACGEWRPL